MSYVIKHKESGAYVAPPGHRTSYVAKLENARVFATEAEAKAELCVESEVVRPR